MSALWNNVFEIKLIPFQFGKGTYCSKIGNIYALHTLYLLNKCKSSLEETVLCQNTLSLVYKNYILLVFYSADTKAIHFPKR